MSFLQIELKMKKAEGIRWSSLEGEDEVKAKLIPKQGQSCWYKTFKRVIIVTCKMAQTVIKMVSYTVNNFLWFYCETQEIFYEVPFYCVEIANKAQEN